MDEIRLDRIVSPRPRELILLLDWFPKSYLKVRMEGSVSQDKQELLIHVKQINARSASQTKRLSTSVPCALPGEIDSSPQDVKYTPSLYTRWSLAFLLTVIVN